MKKNKQTVEQTIASNQKTNSGIYLLAGDIQASDYDSKTWAELQKDYYTIRNSDALATTTIDILKYPILMSEHRIESKNKDVVEYVNWVFNGLKKGFQYHKYHKLLALDFGLSMHEMVVKRGDTWNGKLTNRPVWFNPIQNETIDQFKYDENSNFTGIIHQKRVPEKDSTLIELKAEDLDYFTYNEEFNDIRGRAIYRQIRFFWEAKHKILNAKTTATQRGAGIVGIGVAGDPTDTDKATIEKIGRSICQLKDGYFSYNSEKIKVDLLEPKSQADVIALLDYLDRQMFFNTLSMFMTTGVGQNGSRSAGAELKAPYELFASYILQLLEKYYQGLTDRIIDMSCFANIPTEERPTFHFSAIRNIDLLKVSTYMKTLMESGLLTKTFKDEEMIRELFGMPELVEPEGEASTSAVAPVEKTEETPKALSKKPRERKLSKECLEFEQRVFSLESANEHFLTMQEKTDAVIADITKEFMKDVASQLRNNRKADIKVKFKFVESGIAKLLELYKEGYDRGQKDVKAEIAKVGKGSMSLATSPGKPPSKKSIENNIKRLFFNIKGTVENKMGSVSDQFVKNQGGLDEYLKSFEDGFKGDKNALSSSVEESYTDGRGETLYDLGDDIETYYYTATLDKNLCDSCAPFDGLIMTKGELDEAGLSLTSPINPECQGLRGENNCRCQIVAYEVK